MADPTSNTQQPSAASNSTSSEPAAVLEFWFGALDDDHGFPSVWGQRWFGADHNFDDTVRAQFEPLIHAIAAGQHDDWRATATGALALVIALDQFTRNCFRGTPHMYKFDHLARQVANESLEHGFDWLVHPVQSVFFYMPFEHHEDLASQERAVTLFRMLQRGVNEKDRAQYAGFLDHALAHRDIIARFGRFPHRNAIIGRTNTTAETHFLAAQRQSSL
ncbi:DUF924 domain-containing protein [Salinisphaera sp. USBA-960]|nr:DUF924 domain-containing protein [Salifodinibacter halophilus]NNC26351.1 DUF924 domain-containing protein [Salifodinibacter halophilus]